MSPAKKDDAAKDDAVNVVKFFDAAYPDNIPAGSRSCVYVDGEFRARPKQVARLGPVRYITVLGNFSGAGCADYEPGNLIFGVPGKLRTWALGRRSMNCRARVYSDLENLGAAVEQTGDLQNVVYWVAVWGKGPLTLDEIVSLCEPHARVHPSRLWAHQYDDGVKTGYDSSVLFGAW